MVDLNDWTEMASRQDPETTQAASTAAGTQRSLPIVGPIVKRIRHRAPDQRVTIINESPEESCTHLTVTAAGGGID